MWISLLLCLGTWMGFAWFDAPTNTATRPAGEVGAVREVDSRPVIAGWESFSAELLDINKIRVGMRVAAENPEVSDAERRTFVDPDPETWRFLKLRLPKSADPRDFVEIEMLRPVAWLEQHMAEVGGRVLLDLEELGAKGWADVLEIGPCPEIVPGPGSVVTATFAHQPTSEILDVTISVDRQSPGGLTLDQSSSQDTSSLASETIGVTANHPFWSVDHQAFVPVGHLEPGTRVKTHLDQIQTIVSLHPRPGPPEKVYNLEVHGEHVYFVGQSSVLVHDSYLEIDPGRLKVPVEKADDVVGTLDKARRQIAEFGYRTVWSTPIEGIRDRFGNIMITNGVTRAIRLNHLNKTAASANPKFLNRKIKIEITDDPTAEFRTLGSISGFPSL